MSLKVPSGAELSDVSKLASQLCESDGEIRALLTSLMKSPESLDRLSEDRADSIMLKTLAWLHALDDESFEFEDIIRAFHRKHADVFRGSTVFDGAEEIILERIHRTFVGVAQGIETTLPRQLRRTGGAAFRIDWTDEGGTGAWDSDESDSRNSIPIRPLVFQAAEVFGELEESDQELLATAILEDLREGALSLPGFGLRPTPEEKLLHNIFGKVDEADQETVLRWKPPETEIDPKHFEAAYEDMDPKSIGRLHEEVQRLDSDATTGANDDSQTIREFLSELSRLNVPAETEGIVAEIDEILHCLDRSDSDAVKNRLLKLRDSLLAKPLDDETNPRS